MEKERQDSYIIAKLREELQEKDQIIDRMSHIDALTGLLNWASIKEYLEIQIQQRQGPLGLVFIDFDSFKAFNRTYGYSAGDLLLAQFGEKAAACVSVTGGAIGRLNGDTFIVVLPDTTPMRMQELSEALFAVISGLTVAIPGTQHFKADITAGIGCVLWNRKTEMSRFGLLRQADLSMRQAKKNGRGKYHFAEADELAQGSPIDAENKMAIQLAIEMRGALSRGEFEPYYQPIYSIACNRPIMAEALVRWRHPVFGVLPPDQFIPMFEESGLIINLDLYMFECSCRNIRRWIDQGLRVVPVCCNFSRLHFLSDGFAERLHKIAAKHHVGSHLLEIEITENMLVENTADIIRQMKELRSLGFAIAMDDFGSGYSSFGMLEELPVDTIKLDRSFFVRSLQDFRNTSIICAILAIARALGMSVICEGIENGEQVAFLKSVGCDAIQGFYYASPMDLTGFEAVLRTLNEGPSNACCWDNTYHILTEAILDQFFVTQNFCRFTAYMDRDISWKDLFCENSLHGSDQLREHFERNIKGRKLSLIYRSITPRYENHLLLVSGEAVLIDEDSQPPFCRNFYFTANCIIKNEDVVMTKLQMDLIRSDSYVNLFRAQNEIKTGITKPADETAELSPYYSMLPLGIIRYELNADMSITYMNQAMFDIIGYTREQFWGEMGGNLRAVVHPDDLNQIYQDSLRMIEGEYLKPFIYRFIRHDGSISRVLYYQATVTAADHRPLIQGMYIGFDQISKFGGKEG